MGTDKSFQPGCEINWGEIQKRRELPCYLSISSQLEEECGLVRMVAFGAGGGWRSIFSMDHLGFPKLRVTLSISFQLVSLLP